MHEEHLTAQGHEHVQGTHASTLEITTDDWLTPAGDCIVGIEADRSPADFSEGFVAACQDADSRITAVLETAHHRDRVTGRGDPDLTFESDRSMVLRTSDYVDERTVMCSADGAATDLDRDLIAALANGAALSVTLRVE